MRQETDALAGCDMFITRTISGIVLLALIICGNIAGGIYWLLFAGVLSLSAIYELFKALSLHRTVMFYIALFTDIVLYCVLYIGYEQLFFAVVVLYFIVLMGIYVIKWPAYDVHMIADSLFIFIYAGLCMSYLYQVRAVNYGMYYIWLVFIVSWGNDTFAYLTGILLGKHKLPGTLSPKKTIEGCIGGAVGVVIIAFFYGLYLTNYMDDTHSFYIIFPIICGIGALMSQVGDLAASAVKRNKDIKDYGKLIPGHGGIMDRFDSVVYVAPVVYYLMVLYTGQYM